jgi:hypothetical protein
MAADAAVKNLNPRTKSSKRLADVRSLDENVAPEQERQPEDLEVSLKVRVIALMRDIGEIAFEDIDRILMFPKNYSRRLYEANRDQARMWRERQVDTCVQNFYRNRITLLEHLISAAPRSIAYWRKIIEDPESHKTDLKDATKEIRAWTEIFLKTKNSSAVRDLLSDDLKEVADEADNMHEMLLQMTGRALDGTEN